MSEKLPGMRFGPELLADGSAVFRLWAPSVPEVGLEIVTGHEIRRHRMGRSADGWHMTTVPGTSAGTRYRYAINELRVPDPASRYQPDDVHGSSELVCSDRYQWGDQAWRGRPWHEAVIYELHIGTFTPEGTYAAALRQLGDLVELGITAIELMPVAEFPGQRNWGYDGALLFAPDTAYGHPDELKAFVDRAHALGLMVLLDVVYNHFGPDGNYLHAWCPEFFNPRHQTPWGASINFDGHHNGPVRQFYVENALYWVEEFHFDGLRLDAIHQIRDDSPLNIIREIAAAFRSGPGAVRQVHLVLENDANDATLLSRAERARSADAQWNDDFHHAAQVALTGDSAGHMVDYQERTLEQFGRSLAEGFIYQGQESAYRKAARGTPSTELPSNAFISFMQNHDQIGNRAFGDRISDFAPQEPLIAVYACLLLAPHVPMLFMGEEYAASTPFLFFCDFHGELARQVSKGRREEFAGFPGFDDPATTDRIPDPNDIRTFEQCKLRWDEREVSPHKERLALVRELLTLRHRHLTPRMGGQVRSGSHRLERDVIRVEWMLADGLAWHMCVNLRDAPAELVGVPSGKTIYERHVERADDGAVKLGGFGVLVVAVGD